MKREMKNTKNLGKPEHITRGSVFEDIGFTPEESAVLIVKSQIHDLILEQVKKKRHSRRDLEKILDVPQPRISELMTGRISHVSIEKLLKYVSKLGLHVEVYSRQTRRAA